MSLAWTLATPGLQPAHARSTESMIQRSGFARFDRLSEELEDALDACQAHSEPDTSCAGELERAIAALDDLTAPIARRRSVLGTLRRARLELVRATFALGRTEPALARLRSMEAVRSLSPQERESLGPMLQEHAEDAARQVSDQRQIRLVVECGSPCTITLNNTLVGAFVFLPPGSYRLGVVNLEGASNELVRTLDLRASTPELHLEFATTRATTPPSAKLKKEATTPTVTTIPAPKLHEARPRPRFIHPKRALQLGMVLGVASTIAGSVLLSMDGNCPSHGVQGKYGPAPQGNCRDAPTETTIPGVITLGLGIPTVITVATLMGLWRKRNRGRHPKHKSSSWQRGLPPLEQIRGP